MVDLWCHSVPRPAGCLLCHAAFTTWIEQEDLGDDLKYERCHFYGQFSGFVLSPTSSHSLSSLSNTHTQELLTFKLKIAIFSDDATLVLVITQH